MPALLSIHQQNHRREVGPNETPLMQSPPRTEVLLARIRCLCAGEEDAAEVLNIIDLAHSHMKSTWQKFLIESTEDAEMPVETRGKIAQSLEDYMDTLLAMRDAIDDSDLDLLSQGLEKAETNVETIRAAQNEHKASLLAGPTLFPFLNRLLIQTSTVRAGADSMRLTALLNDAPSFLRSLRTELESRATSPLKAQVVYQIQQTFEALQAALQAEEALPEIEEDITEFASQLAGLLAEAPLESSLRGSTPLSAINQVLRAVGSLSGANEDLDFFLALLDQSRNQLRSLLPPTSPLEHLDRLNLVLDDLDTLQRCVTEEAGYDDMLTATSNLESSATELSTVLPGPEATENAYSEFLNGLPPLFRSILLPGYAFLDGQASADDVFAASDHLEESASEMMRETEELPQDDATLGVLKDALEDMREAADMLRLLAESANAQYLEAATSLCYQASEQMKQTKIGP